MKAPHLGPKSVTTGGAKDLDETQAVAPAQEWATWRRS
jgi:hypothetical protein